ncbi:MAG: hypothetical protein ABW277_27175, partial [Longimicrobiaceae bacterium]
MSRETGGPPMASKEAAPLRRTTHGAAPGLLRPPTPWLADVEPGRVPEVERLPDRAEVVVVGGGVIG